MPLIKHRLLFLLLNGCYSCHWIHLTWLGYFTQLVCASKGMTVKWPAASVMVICLDGKGKGGSAIHNMIHNSLHEDEQLNHSDQVYIEGILPKGPYLPCLRMADRALLAGYPPYVDPNLTIAVLLDGQACNLACIWWAVSCQEAQARLTLALLC